MVDTGLLLINIILNNPTIRLHHRLSHLATVKKPCSVVCSLAATVAHCGLNDHSDDNDHHPKAVHELAQPMLVA